MGPGPHASLAGPLHEVGVGGMAELGGISFPLVPCSGPGTWQLAQVEADTASLPVSLGSAGDRTQGHLSQICLTQKPDRARGEALGDPAGGLGPACHDAHWASLGHLGLPAYGVQTRPFLNPEGLFCFLHNSRSRDPSNTVTAQQPGTWLSPRPHAVLSPSEAVNSLPPVCIRALLSHG